jgi:hypothetical protein
MMHRPSKSVAGLGSTPGQQQSTVFLENHRKSLKVNQQNINFFRKHRKMSGGSKSNAKVSQGEGSPKEAGHYV